MRRARVLWVLFLLGSCTSEVKFPGDEVMGTFDFVAEPLSNGCPFAEITDGGFEFSGTFSRNKEGGEAYFTVGGFSRDAGFDGQAVESWHVAPRRFEACECRVPVQVEEGLRVALLSRSQNDALGGNCPAEPFDGGVPLVGGDAGIEAPGSRTTGFDAIRACGELWDLVRPPEDCQLTLDDETGLPRCPECAVGYRVTGVRR